MTYAGQRHTVSQSQPNTITQTTSREQDTNPEGSTNHIRAQDLHCASLTASSCVHHPALFRPGTPVAEIGGRSASIPSENSRDKTIGTHWYVTLENRETQCPRIAVCVLMCCPSSAAPSQWQRCCVVHAEEPRDRGCTGIVSMLKTKKCSICLRDW